MAQGGTHIPMASPGSPTKASTTKAAVPAAAKPAAPAAPKAQPRPAPAAAAKPVAIAPAATVQKPAPPPLPVENSDTMETRIGPSPIAAVKPLQQASLQSHQDTRAVVRALIDASIAPIEQTLRDLQRRIEELELARARLLASPPAHVAYAPAQGHAAPRAPVLDIATIERTVALGPEAEAFDGSRRRRRLFVATAVGIVVVFGGLFAALAQSYTHAHP